MFLIDFFKGRMVPDEELKNDFANRRPYGEWLANQKLELSSLPKTGNELHYEPESLVQRMQAFGYTVETMQFMLLPLVTEARDPLGSMGNDSALACLSDKSRLIYDYFKQLFAQITNPPIDSIREEVVMSLECFIGPEANLLDVTEEHAHRLSIPHPILSNDELASIKNMDTRGWKTQTIDITFEKSEGKAGMLAALDRILQRGNPGNRRWIFNHRAVGQEHQRIAHGTERAHCLWHRAPSPGGKPCTHPDRYRAGNR